MFLGEQTAVVLILPCFSKEVIKISKDLEVIAKSHHRRITPSKPATLTLPMLVSLKGRLYDSDFLWNQWEWICERRETCFVGLLVWLVLSTTDNLWKYSSMTIDVALSNILHYIWIFILRNIRNTFQQLRDIKDLKQVSILFHREFLSLNIIVWWKRRKGCRGQVCFLSLGHF